MTQETTGILLAFAGALFAGAVAVLAKLGYTGVDSTLATALRTVLQDPAAARTRADNALHNLQAHFTWQAVFVTMMKIAQSAPSRR